MASCPGTKNGSRCGQTLMRCPHCGNVGCKTNHTCTNSMIDGTGKCRKCGKIPSGATNI